MGIVISFKEYKEQVLGCSARVQVPLWVQWCVHPWLWFLLVVPCTDTEEETDIASKKSWSR